MDANFCLTAWQKKQAAMLNHFSSIDYLKGLKDRLNALGGFTEDTLHKSRVQGRDKKLRSARWGNRNTSANWAVNGWSFLRDFQRSVERDIADRAAQIYHVTGAYQCGRGMSEFSMLWTTPAEQERFEGMFAELSRYAGNIDDTMNKTCGASRWDDFMFAIEWQRHAEHFPIVPKFRVLTDIAAQSGQTPPRTGVYVSADDPDASLQFAWTGNAYGKLLDCATFNDFGNAALAATGRGKLWVDGKAILDFVRANLSHPDIRSDSSFEGDPTEDLAPSLVARNAFTSQPSRWYYVEVLNGEFEPLDVEA